MWCERERETDDTKEDACAVAASGGKAQKGWRCGTTGEADVTAT